MTTYTWSEISKIFFGLFDQKDEMDYKELMKMIKKVFPGLEVIENPEDGVKLKIFIPETYNFEERKTSWMDLSIFTNSVEI